MAESGLAELPQHLQIALAGLSVQVVELSLVSRDRLAARESGTLQVGQGVDPMQQSDVEGDGDFERIGAAEQRPRGRRLGWGVRPRRRQARSQSKDSRRNGQPAGDAARPGHYLLNRLWNCSLAPPVPCVEPLRFPVESSTSRAAYSGQLLALPLSETGFSIGARHCQRAPESN